MPRVVGFDLGTVSLDVLGLDDGEPCFHQSIHSSDLASNPRAIVDLLKASGPFDLVVGPSGYGLPLVPIERVGESELKLLCLGESGGGSGVPGLRALIRALAEIGSPVVFTPGVVHLPSVPEHRKVNRVDLGTADKVCAAAFAIAEQARLFGLPYAGTALVLVELGGAFTAVVTVEGGKIVSGQGGSSGPMGFLSPGALDGEVAVLLSPIGKETLFTGGAAFVAGDPRGSPGEVFSRGSAASRVALAALVEGVVRAVAAELAVGGAAREIVLSGRLSRIVEVAGPLADALGGMRPVRFLNPPLGLKEGAFGAAIVADGLAGGRYADLVETMELRRAEGSVLDHIHLAGREKLGTWLNAS
jgi:predicted butyrate kinase (DUF1464 family)